MTTAGTGTTAVVDDVEVEPTGADVDVDAVLVLDEDVGLPALLGAPEPHAPSAATATINQDAARRFDPFIVRSVR